jgi:hypothetical protein
MPRLNYTNRIQIDKDKVHLSAATTSRGIVKVTGDIVVDQPSDYPPSAEVHLYLRRAPHARFSLRLGPVESKMMVDADVPALTGVEGLKIDVRIVDMDDPSRRILAICQSVALASDEDGATKMTGLLGVRKGEFRWPLWLLKLEDLDSSGAWLEFSKSVEDFKSIPKSDAFKTLVLPEAIRQVAMKIIQEIKYDRDPSAGDEVQDKWVRWFVSLPGMGNFSGTMNDAERETFVEEVVMRFCEQPFFGHVAKSYFVEEGTDL